MQNMQSEAQLNSFLLMLLRLISGQAPAHLASACCNNRYLNCSGAAQQNRSTTAEASNINWTSHPNSVSLRETPSAPPLMLLGLSFQQNFAV